MDKYLKIKELNESVYEFAVNAVKCSPACGHYSLEGGAWANVSEMTTKDQGGARLERHRKYTDVQMLLEGEETIGVCNIALMEKEGELVSPYNEEKDYELYDVPHTDLRVLHRGDYLILGPEDGHSPGLCVSEPTPSKKIIIKIPVR